MKVEPVYITELIGNVVAATSTALLTELQAVDPKITQIWYEYGHYPDIRERLIARSKAAPANYRYPLIALFEDFRIRKSQIGIFGIAEMKLIILYSSKKDITREQREQDVFRPILYPIYSEFLTQLKKSGKFMIYDETRIQHDQINRPHWGDPALYKNDSYIFNEVLDGIEINNLQLTTNLKNCF